MQDARVVFPVRPGDVIAERYRVERVLGEGGMGVVVEAHHLMLGERVAVKFLLPAALQIPDVLTRFQREARSAARVQSEHVARVMDVGVLPGGQPYLVMEYLEGRDLKSEVEHRGPLPVEEAAIYVLQAACGVADAHALGIVHRDLKPSNLFLARLRSGRTIVKVLDFGIAKDVAPDSETQLTRTYSTLGSAPYMSPEQVRAAKSVDGRTDVWALGVVLYELLTDRLPFDGDSVTAVAAAIIADQPASLTKTRADIPRELEYFMIQCLEKDLNKRFASLATFAAALAPFAGPDGSIYAARVAQTLGVGTSRPPVPSGTHQAERPPSGHDPTLVSAKTPHGDKRDITRSTWASTGGSVRRSLTQRQTVLVTGSTLGGALVLAGIWFGTSRPKAESALPAASSSITAAAVQTSAATATKTDAPRVQPVVTSNSAMVSAENGAGVEPKTASSSTAVAATTAKPVSAKSAPKRTTTSAPKPSAEPASTAPQKKEVDPDALMRRTL